MGLRFDPVGKGMFKQAIQATLESESVPMRNTEAHKRIEQAKLKLFDQFKSKFGGLEKSLDNITTFREFRELKVDLGDGAKQMSVTVDKDKATTGDYQLSIESLAKRTSVISNNFKDPNKAVLGMGFITLDKPGGGKAEIYVPENKASLNGIARLINEQDDFPVRAAVVKDESHPDKPWKLIMTAKKDGKENNINFPDFYFLDGDEDLYLDGNRNAQNAVVKVDGFPIQVDSNDVKDFLPGVNLHLKQAKPGKSFTMRITQDYKKIAGKVKDVVTQVNGILQFINKQNMVNKDSDTRSTFAGDSGLQSIEYRLRNMMHQGFGVGNPHDKAHFKVHHLDEMGIEFDKNGSLTFNEQKFQKFMENDFQGVAQVFSGPFGFAFQMKTLLQGYTEIGTGMLDQRENSIRARIKQMDDEIDEDRRNLDQRQKSLTEQYSRLEASLGAMQQQQQYLSASLPGASGGGGIAQLLGG